MINHHKRVTAIAVEQIETKAMVRTLHHTNLSEGDSRAFQNGQGRDRLTMTTCDNAIFFVSDDLCQRFIISKK